MDTAFLLTENVFFFCIRSYFQKEQAFENDVFETMFVSLRILKKEQPLEMAVFEHWSACYRMGNYFFGVSEFDHAFTQPHQWIASFKGVKNGNSFIKNH